MSAARFLPCFVPNLLVWTNELAHLLGGLDQVLETKQFQPASHKVGPAAPLQYNLDFRDKISSWQAVDSDESDPEFSAAEEAEGGIDSDEEDSSGEEGPSSGRIRPKRVRNDASWEVKAMQEAEKMIAAAEAKNKKEADVGESVLHQVHQLFLLERGIPGQTSVALLFRLYWSELVIDQICFAWSYS